jgi:hypothetical protein
MTRDFSAIEEVRGQLRMRSRNTCSLSRTKRNCQSMISRA